MRRRVDRILFFMSAGVILYEITITRLFSVLMWYHFVSFAVALALSGMALGALVALRAGSMGDRELASFFIRWGLVSTLGCLVVYLAFVAVSVYPALGYRVLAPLHQTYYEPFRAPAVSGGRGFVATVGLILALFSIPFVGGGAIFAASFEVSRDRFISYAHAMVGSAVGVIVYLVVMLLGSAPGALVVSSILFLVAATSDEGGKAGKTVRATLGIVVVCLLAWNYAVRPADPSFVRGRYEPDILWSRWDATSRVVVFPIPREELLRGFGEGDRFTGSPPDALGMVVDDTGYTVMFKGGEGEGDEGFREFFRHNLAAVPFELAGGGDALIIGPGGGKDVHAARVSGDFRIKVVELNGLVVKAVEDVFADFTGKPYSKAGVDLRVDEGRVFIERDEGTYDVVEMTQVFGRVPPQAGAFTLTENHLYTIEAVRGMLSLLKRKGMLSITRFSFEKTGPRLVNLMREALRLEGVEKPENSILIAGSRGVMNVIAFREEVSPRVVERFRKICEERGFTALYFPGIQEGGATLVGRIVMGEAGERDVSFDITLPTDDRPFFYYTIKPEDFVAGNFAGPRSTEERGAYLVRKTLFPLFLVSAAAVLAFSFFSGYGPFGRRFFSYVSFFLSGAAFVSLEVILIKKLIVLLGFPVYSLSCVLLSVLVFSGIGSFAAALLNVDDRWKVGGAALILALVLFIYRFGSDTVIRNILAAPAIIRFSLAFFLAGIPALFAGVPFPSLLNLYNRKKQEFSAFPIFVNGFASIVGSFLFLAVSLNFGYGAVIILTGAAYATLSLIAFSIL